MQDKSLNINHLTILNIIHKLLLIVCCMKKYFEQNTAQ